MNVEVHLVNMVGTVQIILTFTPVSVQQGIQDTIVNKVILIIDWIYYRTMFDY